MKTIIKSSEIRHLSAKQRVQVILDAYKAAKPVDSRTRVKELRAEIAKLEKRHSMSTEKMLKRLCSGDLLKDEPFSTWQHKYMLLRAHQENVHSGRRHVPPEVAARLAEYIGDADLTTRELQVLRLIRDGYRNKQIADQLVISENTVNFHIKNLMEKLRANDRTHAVTIALRRGLLQI